MQKNLNFNVEKKNWQVPWVITFLMPVEIAASCNSLSVAHLTGRPSKETTSLVRLAEILADQTLYKWWTCENMWGTWEENNIQFYLQESERKEKCRQIQWILKNKLSPVLRHMPPCGSSGALFGCLVSERPLQQQGYSRDRSQDLRNDNFTCCDTRDSGDTMTSVSAGHIILTPIQPVESGNQTQDFLTKSDALYRLSYRRPPLQ